MSRLAISVAAVLAISGCGADSGEAEDKVENILILGTVPLSASNVDSRIDGGSVILIDVRTPEEFAQGHLEGAVNMPVDTFDPTEVPKIDGREPVFYCRSGRRSEIAGDAFAGYTGQYAKHLDGGILAWQEAGLPVVKPGAPTP